MQEFRLENIQWFIPFYYKGGKSVGYRIANKSYLFTEEEFNKNCITIAKSQCLYNGETYFYRKVNDTPTKYLIEKQLPPIVAIAKDYFGKIVAISRSTVPSYLGITLIEKNNEFEEDKLLVVLVNDLVDVEIVKSVEAPVSKCLGYGDNEIFNLFVKYHIACKEKGIERWKEVDIAE